MIVRPMRPEDRRYIAPTWVRSLAASRRVGPHRRDWKHVDHVLDDRAALVVVLASDAASRTVHAWAAALGGVLQYAYVPPELRRQGLAKRCITAALGSYPEHIAVATPWPYPSQRYHLLRRIAA